MFRSLIFRVVISFAGILIVSSATASSGNAKHLCKSSLVKAIPNRTNSAIDASSFVSKIDGVRGKRREALILKQVMTGNVPSFLRHLHPVTIKKKTGNGAETVITLCVMPDYLAVGSNGDFLRVPLEIKTAMRIARRFGFVLPTPKIVDAINAQADAHLAPSPMTPGSQMTSTDYYSRHNRMVEQQRQAKGISLGLLLAGQKKDLVITNRLRKNPGRVAIYGWHRLNGRPIQPLSTVHGDEYADYSHGVRLVSATAYVNGKKRSLYDLLENPKYASLISREGGIPHAARLAGVKRNITAIRLAASIKHRRDDSESPGG